MVINPSTSGQNPTVYAFVDGGYIRKRFHDMMMAVFGEVPDIEFFVFRSFLGASRVFFYDCEYDTQGESFPAEREWSSRQHINIRKADHSRLRLGTLSRGGKRKEVGQKEVDVLLAVDMLSRAYGGSMDEAVLVAGDLDFRPVIDEVVRYRTQVKLVFDVRSCPQELRDCVDVRYALTFFDYYNWTGESFKGSHKIPAQRNSLPGDARCIRHGSANGRIVELYSSRDRTMYLSVSNSKDSHESKTLYAAESASDFLITKFAPAVIGEIVWNG